MSKRRKSAYVWQSGSTKPSIVNDTVPRDLHDLARRCLIKLFRDSLSLNDQISHQDQKQRHDYEDEIVDDFQNVSEFIQYLLLKLEKQGVYLEDDEPSKD